MRNMKKLSILLVASLLLTACGKSLEDKAAEEAKEYTRKYCPTPVVNNSRTDSITFTKADRTYHYYCSFVGPFDDERMIQLNLDNLRETLIKEVKNNTSVKKLKEAGFRFHYIVRSGSNPKKVLYEQTITEKEYK